MIQLPRRPCRPVRADPDLSQWSRYRGCVCRQQAGSLERQGAPDRRRGARRGSGLVRPSGDGPLIVAALISTQVVPLVGWGTRRSIPRGLAVVAELNRRGADRGRAGADVPGCAVRESGVGDAISEGADAVVARLQDNNAWISGARGGDPQLSRAHPAGREGRRRRLGDRRARRASADRAHLSAAPLL